MAAQASEGERRPRVRIVPLTLPKANKCVEVWHRHHAPIPGGFMWYAIGAVVDGRIVGAAIAGRPTNRNNDDRQTVEVLRIATDGTPNACSALLGACARAARAIGASRILTYTLTAESGSSLRGAGWVMECSDTGKSWWGHAGTRTPAVHRDHFASGKVRWALQLGDRCEYEFPFDEPLPIEAAAKSRRRISAVGSGDLPSLVASRSAGADSGESPR